MSGTGTPQRSLRLQAILHAIAAPVALALSVISFATGGTLSGVFFALVALMSGVAVLAVVRRARRRARGRARDRTRHGDGRRAG